MTIAVNRYALIDALKKCKNFVVDKKNMRINFRYIHCNINETRDSLHLFALDSAKAFEIYLTCKCNNIGEDERSFILPVDVAINKKGSETVTLIIEKERVTIKDDSSINIYENDLTKVEHYTLDRFIPKEQPTTTIYFNPELLTKAIKDFEDVIRIDIYNPKQGIIIIGKNNSGKAFVLPVNPAKEGF